MAATSAPARLATHRRRRRLPRPGPGHARWRLRDWRVGSKVAAVLAIPALAFLVVATVQAGLSFRQAAAMGEFAEQMSLGRQVTTLVHELQYERDLVTGELAAASAVEDRISPPVNHAREAVDRARQAFQAAGAPMRDRAPVAPALAEAGAALDALATVRAGYEQGWLRRQAAFDGYTRAIEALLALLPAPPADYDAEVRGYQELALVKEFQSRIRAHLYAVAGAGGFAPGQRDLLVDTRALRHAAQDRFRATATAGQLAHFDEVVRGQAVRASARLEQALLEQAGAAGPDVAPQQWWSAATTELERTREVEAALLGEVLAQVERDSRHQWRQTLLVTVLALLVLVTSLLLGVGIGRSMVRSLRSLRRQAVQVARSRLPGLLERLRDSPAPQPDLAQVAPTTVGGADEVGEVAEAFTMVHRSAVQLAVEQAQMRHNVNRIFINLARRSQVLVERQLELLDELERDESDPARLEHLFQLDHLTTRMRRNNDSLLVLTGRDPDRRYRRPVPLASVALAAIAEIERYQRVRDQVPTDLYVVGHLVADLVHLLAELLDNATAFSSRDSTVLLGARRADPADSPGVLIEVADEGMGMTPHALQEANAVLTDPPAIDVAASERMGLVVVGHLAARQRLTVRLAAARRGVRATVWLPERLRAAAGADPLGSGPPGSGPPAGPPGSGTPAFQPPGPLPPGPGQVVVRAEHVLSTDPATSGSWWSRPPGRPTNAPAAPNQPAVPARPAAAVVPAPPAGAGDADAEIGGLPVRVPMAQLPATDLFPPPTDLEPDPDEIGDTLTAFYGGIQRAEAEDTDHTPTGGGDANVEDGSGTSEPTSA